MNKQQAIEEHRKLWTWIAEKTLQMKRKIEKKAYFKYTPRYQKNDCFCCGYDSQFENQLNCVMCPIDFGVNAEDFMCEKEGSDYLEWENETDYEECAELALKIANLPERKLEDE